ncbi:MAG: PP2C family protein-serine/threonine phosphatase [Vicinamibacterales bacterium]
MNADGVEACGVAQFHGAASVLCYDPRTQLHRLLLASYAGRALVAGVALKLLAFIVTTAAPDIAGLALIDTLGDLCLIGGGLVMAFRLSRVIRARLLWRVRRKLILSYIFIGVVPALLIVAFFMLAGLMLMFSVSSYLIQSRVRALVDETTFVAQKAALEYSRAVARGESAAWLRQANAGAQPYPGTTYALLDDSRCDPTPGPPTQAAVPAWVACTGFGGLVQQEENGPLTVRAAAPPVEPAIQWVVVDVPITEVITHRLRDETGIDVGEVTTGAFDSEQSDSQVAAAGRAGGGLQWVTFLDYTQWQPGERGTATAAIRLTVTDVYNRISAAQIASMGNMNFGQLLLVGLALVGASFVVIQLVAFGMGIGLARSITGSIHELFAGTERVRQGDFTQRIAIRSRDQLGELAESFNLMTGSIEDLMRQKAEKERMEQELRIAREIQMSLLPHGPLHVPGFAVSGHCEPAREVGGDYFDVLPLPEGRTGVLVADVAGKGTSAALYMAELKGLILSLSRHHRSPRELLIEANRLIAQHLDDRSFITMTYAVLDPAAGTLTCARAGHCPMVFRDATATRQRTRIIAPEGLVVGLKIDDGTMFERLLEEVTLPLTEGDVMLFFTDGLTEAMNPEGDCFGDERLTAIVDDHGAAGPDALRDQILREVRGVAGAAAQHDDMTMQILQVKSQINNP